VSGYGSYKSVITKANNDNSEASLVFLKIIRDKKKKKNTSYAFEN
jgi:hypothetical protein